MDKWWIRNLTFYYQWGGNGSEMVGVYEKKKKLMSVEAVLRRTCPTFLEVSQLWRFSFLVMPSGLLVTLVQAHKALSKVFCSLNPSSEALPFMSTEPPLDQPLGILSVSIDYRHMVSLFITDCFGIIMLKTPFASAFPFSFVWTWIYLDYWIYLRERPVMWLLLYSEVFLDKGACEYYIIFSWNDCSNQSWLTLTINVIAPPLKTTT